MDKRKAFIFLLTIYIIVSAIGISTYIKHRTSLTGMTTSPQGTVNLTIEPGNDVTAPSVRIISPTGTVTNTTSISVHINFTDNQALGTCWYNVTNSTNGLVGNAFRQLICTSGRDSLNVSLAGTYTIHAFANDTTNNKNLTTQGNFTAEAAAAARTTTETTTTTPTKVTSGHQAYGIQSESLEITYTAGQDGERTFSILNPNDNDMAFAAYLLNLDGIIGLDENEFTIPARTEYKLKLKYIGSEPGEYTGELVIESNNLVRKVAVAVSVAENMNDVGLVLDYPSIFNEVCRGCEIGFSINLESEEKNFKAVYTIKDFEDNVMFRKNEVISVKDLPYYKVIELPDDMEEGSYVLFVAVNTEGKTQVASHLFNVVRSEIREEKPSITSNVLIALLLFVLIIVNMILMRKTK